MLVQYASDLHLEFSENRRHLKTTPLEPKGEILILAGDILLFKEIHLHKDFFKYVSDHFAATYWVPGNHEYYHFDAATKCGILNEEIHENVFLVNNIELAYKYVRMLFTTLWSKIDPAYRWQIERGMNDFHVVKFGPNRFSSEVFDQLHAESLEFLQEALAKKHDNTMVITHHIPTLMNYPAQYKGSALNSAFAVELYNLIETCGAKYWIYGHHHFNIEEFAIGNTKMLTNQMGYVSHGEHLSFDHGKCIEMPV